MELILASTSPYRRALLERLGVAFAVEAPEVDEEEWKARGFDSRGLAEALAQAKALAVAVRHPEAIVIGSDQVAALDGEALGKPDSEAGAIAQLSFLAGRSHHLFTAIVVTRRGHLVAHTDVTTLVMRPLNQEEIRRYVSADRPMDCAGSYKLEKRGISLFERIETADQSAIVGLPLIALTTILRGFGFAIP